MWVLVAVAAGLLLVLIAGMVALGSRERRGSELDRFAIARQMTSGWASDYAPAPRPAVDAAASAGVDDRA